MVHTHTDSKHTGILRMVFNKRIIPSLLLILFFNLFFLPMVSEINRTARAYSEHLLQEMTSQTADDLQHELKKDLEQLQVAAALLSSDPSLEDHVQTVCLALQNGGTAVEAGVLLPDGRVLSNVEEPLPQKLGMSFQTEKEKAPLLASPRITLENSKGSYLLQYVPVEHDSITAAILYGVLDLNEFSARYAPASEKQVDFFVIDGDTGDILIDTWHDTVSGNLYTDPLPDMEALFRDVEEWEPEADLRSGVTHYMEMRLEGKDQSYILYQAPVGINQWRILLIFPREFIFQAVHQIQNTMYRMIIIEMCLFLAYLGWVLAKNYRQSAYHKQQLAQLAGRLDIQQTLFSACQDPSGITTALEKAAMILTADKSFLFSRLPDEEVYVWPERGEDSFDVETMRRDLPQMAETFCNGKSILVDFRQHALRPAPRDRKVFKLHKVTSLMVVPIRNTEKKMIGILGAVNTRKKWDETSLLEGIAHNFMMALENLYSYRIIEEMGIMDALTGLKNRNSYQRALVEKDDIRGCVYLDANGLHELNNQFGHAAGDAMLKAVGTALREAFGPEDTYRIGGDEFVALCRYEDSEGAEEKLGLLRSRIVEQGYHVSSGLAWQNGTQSVHEIITTAEKRMYADKQRYYESLNDPTRQIR